MIPPHILAIDDDPSIREAIADYLADNDLRVTTLASARELAEVMARETIDLLLLDLRLPGEDGMEIGPCCAAAGPRRARCGPREFAPTASAAGSST